MAVEVASNHNIHLPHMLAEVGHSVVPLMPDQHHNFLVSFLVDARGGSMRGSRHPGLRILVPPNAASAPTRITCRVLRSERAANPPPLNDSEGLACRIIELGPYPCMFNSPVLLELPHFASLRGRQRELVVLRSDNGKNWHEHSLEATDQAVKSALGQSFVDENLETSEELREKRIVRILMNNFPQYLAVVSRLRQEASLIGSDGGVLSSSVVPQVQAVFPEGALLKRIRVGLQAHPISDDLVTSMFGSRVAVSPIVTLEPRRRKFHKPITLTIPLPKLAYQAMQGNDSAYLNAQNAPSLRVLCSITEGSMPAQWEDLTGSTPLSKVKDCVAFTTTVSARFWLVYCPAVHESTETATRLYHEASLVPYMCKFAVFSKRQDNDEALLRCFCISDDKVDKTLECQEGFQLCATSQEIEILHDQYAWLSAVGNLLPLARSGEQLRMHFAAFRENRLAFPVRVKDMQQQHVGKLAFVREPRPGTAGSSTPVDVRHPTSPPICTLEVDLSAENLLLHETKQGPLASEVQDTSAAAPSSFSSLCCVYPGGKADARLLPGRDGEMPINDAVPPTASQWPSVYANDVIARTELDLLHVASEVGVDWRLLVPHLLPGSRLGSNCTIDQLVNWINDSQSVWQARHQQNESGGTGTGGLGGLKASELRSESDRALAVLLAWREERGGLATGNELDRALRAIGRMDVVKTCMLGIQYVVAEDEQLEATRRIDGGGERAAGSPELATSTSLVPTEVLESGMEEPSLEWTSAVVLAPDTETVALMSSSTGDGDAGEPTKGEGEEEEQEQHWVSESNECPPVKSTSQQGGDPLLRQASGGAAAGDDDGTRDEVDLVRESESMTASLDERVEQQQQPVDEGQASEEQAVICADVSPAELVPLETQTEQYSTAELIITDEAALPVVDRLGLMQDAHHSSSACASDVEVEFDRGLPAAPSEAAASCGGGENAPTVSLVKGEDDSRVDSEGVATAHHGVESVSPE